MKVYLIITSDGNLIFMQADSYSDVLEKTNLSDEQIMSITFLGKSGQTAQ